MNALFNDIKYGLRQLRKSPGFTVVAVLILALGIGANTALFSLIQGVLFSPLPFTEPERLVLVQWGYVDGGPYGECSGPDYLDLVESNTVFENIAAADFGFHLNLTGKNEPIALTAARVSTNFLETFGITMAQGRSFRLDESERGQHQVVILSDRVWHDCFGADPDIVGQTITLDDASFQVIGVTPPLIGFIEEMVQIYVPLPLDKLQQQRDNHYLTVMARLQPGATIEQAQAQMNVLCTQIEQQHPHANHNRRANLEFLHGELVEGVQMALIVLYGAVGFLLLIACVNVSNLLLAKAGGRAREIAIRCTLGAGRMHIFRQMLTESLLLALLGGMVGLLLAYWGLHGLKIIAPAILRDTGGSIPGLDEISLNPMVLGFTVLVSLISGVFFGVLPAWHSCRFQTTNTLKQGGRILFRGRAHHRTLNLLVGAQIALALILLTGAGLLIRSFSKLHEIQPGFMAKGVLTVTLKRPDTERNRALSERVAFYEQVIDRIRTLPGVEFADAISRPPILANRQDNDFHIKGRLATANEQPNAEYRQVTSDYFRCMNIPLLRGRMFTPKDRGVSRHVIIVSWELVRRYFPNDDPIGQVIRFNNQDKEIIGVVGDVKQKRLNDRERAFMYEPITQNCPRGMSLMIRTTGRPANLAQAVRKHIRDIDPDQPIMRMATMEEIVAESVSVERFCTILLAFMGGVALLMAVAGLYAVMAYGVNERTNEIGIRMALGARQCDILRFVTKNGLILTLIGLSFGIIGALALSRCMSGMLFQISATDPLTFVIVPLMLVVVAMLACWIPARRAAKIDPMEALRYE